MTEKVTLFWFRRDLRLEDNHGLYMALQSGYPVLGVFIFDDYILNQLENKSDARISFIHERLQILNRELTQWGSSLICKIGRPEEVWKNLVSEYSLHSVFTNNDYEPYARTRDVDIKERLKKSGIEFKSFKDQVIFEKKELVKDDGLPYAVFTPYKRKWLQNLTGSMVNSFPVNELIKKGEGKFFQNASFPLPTLEQIGFKKSSIPFPAIEYKPILENYASERDYPAKEATSKISVHLRFGTISIRQLVKNTLGKSESWLSELIWREFYFMILWHFPYVVENCFRKEYDRIPWNNNPEEFEKWCKGITGYPLVDAGMRELNETGFMHNRVRMVVASFLTKHLLIDWRWGANYFAEKLLDFELSSNNGGWQWAAGTGVDAAPYFRIFNPYEQEKKFDPNHDYIKKWVKEWNTAAYPQPMVDHKWARERCLAVYQKALKGEIVENAKKEKQTELHLN